jgi:hypothetical protein
MATLKIVAVDGKPQARHNARRGARKEKSMQIKTKGLALAILLSSTSNLWAAASAEEAARIQAAFQSYLGNEPGVVAVTPNGDGYDVALDPAPYLKKVKQPGFTSAVDPFRFTAIPKGNGQWAVSYSGPYKASASAPDVFSFSMETPAFAWSGTYSDTLFAFLDQTYSISNLTISQTNNDPATQLKTTGVSVIENWTGTSTSTDAGNGLVDGTGEASFSGLVASNTVEVPPELAASMPNLNYVTKLNKAGYTTALKGMPAKPLMDLVAFFVSHAEKELIIKDQAILKEKLLAALPVFASIDAKGTFEGLAFETGYGKFDVASGTSFVNANGVVKQGRGAEGFEFSGIKLPDNLPLPAWTKGLIPKVFKVGVEVSDFDLETPARKFIAEMDVSKPEPVPPGSEAAYMAAFTPKGTMKLTTLPGEISSDLYSLTYEGAMDFSFAGGMPIVNFKIRMKGMDAVIAQLQQAATDPMAQQGMAMLFAAKGISKPDGDSLVWDIVMGADGKPLVNGTDLSSMMGALGGAPAPAP